MRLLFLAILISSLTSKARSQNPKMSYGFYLDVIARNNLLKTNQDYFSALENINKLGFGLGTNFFFNQSQFLSLRISPGLGYEQETIEFDAEKLTRGTISLKIPNHILWKLMSSSNFRLVVGFTPTFGLVGGKDKNSDLNFRQFDLTGDVGLAYYISRKGISIQPEIKYSQSFVDGKSDEDSSYQNSIDSYYRNKFTFTVVLTR